MGVRRPRVRGTPLPVRGGLPRPRRKIGRTIISLQLTCRGEDCAHILKRNVSWASRYGAACQKPCPLRDFKPETRLIENPEARPSACLEKPDRGNIPYFEAVEAAARQQL